MKRMVVTEQEKLTQKNKGRELATKRRRHTWRRKKRMKRDYVAINRNKKR